MNRPMYEPCPICNSTWNIKTAHKIAGRGHPYELMCDGDGCQFYGPAALTVRGARRKWNRYVRKWSEGYEAVKPVILADLDRKLEEMKHNDN